MVAHGGAASEISTSQLLPGSRCITLLVVQVQAQVLSTAEVLKYKYIQFWTNVIKYIPSTFKMYLRRDMGRKFIFADW